MKEKPLCEHFSHYEPKLRNVIGFDGKEFWVTPWPFEYFQYEFPDHWLVMEQDPFSRDNKHQLEFVNCETMEYHVVRVDCLHSGICHELLTITSWSEFFDYIHDMECGTYSMNVSALPLRDAISTRHEVVNPTLLDDLELPF